MIPNASPDHDPHSPFVDYVEQGWVLCPVEPGTKGPRVKDWNRPERGIADPRHAGRLRAAGLMHAYSHTCALDVDAYAAAKDWLREHDVDLDALLFADDAVQIRSGRADHAKLLFRLDDPLPTVQVKAPDGRVLFELRCASAEGLSVQDVLPPSPYPGGGAYAWAGGGRWDAPPPLPAPLRALWQTLLRGSAPAAPAPEAEAPARVTLARGELQALREALFFLDAGPYDRWVEAGMALFELGAPGKALWLAWSATCPEKFDAAVAAAKWPSFGHSRSGWRRVLKLAADAGWVNAGAGSARPAPAAPAAAEAEEDPGVWSPPVMDLAGFPGLLGEFVDVATHSSEASRVAVAANLMAAVSAAVGRGPYQWIGDGTCHARPFFLLCGKSSKARKGTSEHTPRRTMKVLDELLFELDPELRPLRMHDGGLSSGEGVGYELRDPVEKDGDVTDAGQPDKRLLITEPEFAGVLAAASREKSTLSAVIRNLWDGRDIAPLVKNSRWYASAPHAVLVGHVTAAELVARLSDVDARNGFLNRFMLLHVARERLVPFPEPTPAAELRRLATALREVVLRAWTTPDGDILQTGRNCKAYTMTERARQHWLDVYAELTKDEEGLVGALLARTEIYARMLGMIFALLARADRIDRPHLDAALAWIDYWRGSVRFIFGSLASAEAQRELEERAGQVLALLKERGGPVTRSDLVRAFKHRCSAEALARALEHLLTTAPPAIAEHKHARKDGRPGRASLSYSAL